MTWAIDVGARTLFQEARGEPLEGQEAVSHVIWNRVRDGRWGKNIASVCLWRAQFSGWYMPHDPNFAAACALDDADPLLAKLRSILLDAQSAHDFTQGATHYFATSIEAPTWTQDATFCGQFGQQRFFKDVK